MMSTDVSSLAAHNTLALELTEQSAKVIDDYLHIAAIVGLAVQLRLDGNARRSAAGCIMIV
jgi:hypothetical protein